jgi:hypothetical protein
MQKTFTSIISAYILLILASCKHEYIDTPPTLSLADTTWTSVQSINYDKTILKTAFVTNNSLYMIGNNYFLEMNDKEELVKSELISKNGIGTGRFNSPYINSKFSVYKEVNDDKTPIFTIRETTNPKIKTTIDISQIDTNYFYINGYNYPFCAINDENQLILSVAYRNWQNLNSVSYDNYFLIFNLFKSQDSVGYKIDKLIKVPDSRKYNELEPALVTRIFPYDYGFYFTSKYSEVKFVSTRTGSVDKYFPFNGGIFSNRNDTLFLLGYNTQDILSIYSKPKLNTEWNGATLTELPLGFNGYKFKLIDNQYIIYWGSQIWHLTFNDTKNTFSIKEIQNIGLSSAFIEDVCLFNDKIYILSGNGLFTKPLKTFFSYQK